MNENVLEITMSEIDDYSSNEYTDFLMHYGVLKQRRGFRRYQNEDGSLTPLGRIHYGVGEARKGAKKGVDKTSKIVKSGGNKIGEAVSKAGKSIRKVVNPTDEQLAEKYKEAQRKQARRYMKAKIKELNTGKPRKLEDLTDQEVLDRYNRIIREDEINRRETERNRSKSDKFFDTYLKNGVQQGLNNAARAYVEKFLSPKKSTSYKELVKELEAKAKYEELTGGKDSESKEAESNKEKTKQNKSDKNRKSNTNKSNTNKSNTNKSNKEPTQKAKVYSEWDPGDLNRKHSIFSRRLESSK